MKARKTSVRHNSVTEIREIQAVGSENKLCLKAQRYRNLTAHQKFHPACFKMADVIMGKGITSAARCDLLYRVTQYLFDAR